MEENTIEIISLAKELCVFSYGNWAILSLDNHYCCFWEAGFDMYSDLILQAHLHGLDSLDFSPFVYTSKTLSKAKSYCLSASDS